MENNNAQKKRRSRIYKNRRIRTKTRIFISILSTGLVLLIGFGVFRFFHNHVDQEGEGPIASATNETESANKNEKKTESVPASASNKEVAAANTSASSAAQATTSNEASPIGKSDSEAEIADTAVPSSAADRGGTQETAQQEEEHNNSVIEADQEFEDIYNSLDRRKRICGLFITNPEQFDVPGEATIQLDDNIREKLEKTPVCGLAFSGENVRYYEQFQGLVNDLSSFDDALPIELFLMMYGETEDSWFPYLKQNMHYQEDTTLGVINAYGINLYCVPEQEENFDFDGFKKNRIVVCTKDDASKNKTNDKEAGENVGLDSDVIMLSSENEKTNSKPACMSRDTVVQVRKTYGENTVIMTDAMNQDSIIKEYSSGEAVVNALEAGVDIILMPEDFEGAVDAVEKAIDENALSEERIKESLYRVYKIKKEMK